MDLKYGSFICKNFWICKDASNKEYYLAIVKLLGIRDSLLTPYIRFVEIYSYSGEMRLLRWIEFQLWLMKH